MPTPPLFSMLEEALARGGPADCSLGERLLLTTWWLLDRVRDEFDLGDEDAIELFIALAAYAHQQEKQVATSEFIYLISPRHCS